MATEQDIQKRIAEEQAKIAVPSYQDVAFDGAWKRRSGMIWGLAIVGAISGAGIGAAALVAPALFAEVAVTSALVVKSMVAFSALGLSAGWVAGAGAGFPAGAAASTMKEYERRTLARDIEQKIRDNPNATVTLGEHALEPKKEDFGLDGYFNWKTALVLAAIGAVGGAVFATALALGGPATAFAMPAMEFLLGAKASAVAISAYTIGLGAATGAFFGVNIPRIGRFAGNFMSGILSGKAIGAPWPEEANLPELKPILSPVVTKPTRAPTPEVSMEQPVEGKHCGCVKEKAPLKNYEALVNRSIAEADMALSR
jgi:hypothetical protein